MMSMTGARGSGGPARSTWLRMASPPPRSREAAIANFVSTFRHIGSHGFPFDEAATAALGAAQWDRGPERPHIGVTRQLAAIMKSGDRTAALREITAPTLVIHGDRDRMCTRAEAARRRRRFPAPAWRPSPPRARSAGRRPRATDDVDRRARARDVPLGAVARRGRAGRPYRRRMIAISGASGGLGRRVAELVLEQADPTQVVLLTRTPDQLADLARRGARVEKASFKNPTGLKQVLAGTERLLLISTDAVGRRLEQHRQAISAARHAGVWHIAYTSIAQPSSDNPSLVASEHAQTEQALRESGLEWTFPAQQPLLGGAHRGGCPGCGGRGVGDECGEGRTAYVSREDCARAAAAVLLTDGHERESYDITGPEALTQTEVAAIAAELHGAPIE